MVGQLPLAVDIVDIARAIILFVILAGGVARLFIDANRAQKKPAQAPPRPPKPGGRPPNPQQEAIRAEVDEFLRRAGREPQRGDAQPVAAAPEKRPKRPPRIEVIDDSGIELEQKPRRTAEPPKVAKPRQKMPVEPAQRAGMTAEGSRPNFGGTSTPLQTGRLGSAFSTRATELGQDIREADERFEARIHEKFEHPIGTLAARQYATSEALRQELSRTTLADDLMKMLSSPAGVRQAIVLSEILNRPVDRWT